MHKISLIARKTQILHSQKTYLFCSIKPILYMLKPNHSYMVLSDENIDMDTMHDTKLVHK